MNTISNHLRQEKVVKIVKLIWEYFGDPTYTFTRVHRMVPSRDTPSCLVLRRLRKIKSGLNGIREMTSCE